MRLHRRTVHAGQLAVKPEKTTKKNCLHVYYPSWFPLFFLSVVPFESLDAENADILIMESLHFVATKCVHANKEPHSAPARVSFYDAPLIYMGRPFKDL